MSVLIIADHDGTHLRDTTLKTITSGLLLAPSVDLLVFGKDCAGVAEQARQISGVSNVLLAQSDALGAELAEAVSALIVSLAPDYSYVVIPASSSGKNYAPRVAALLDVSLISDVMAIDGPKTFVRPIYAGNALETVEARDAKLVLTIRTTVFSPALAEGGSAALKPIEAANASGARFVSEEKISSERPELGAAKVVVSGGRALGSAEEFTSVLSPLADRLGAALGASRAAVDAGYAPNDYQVGQTGKVVAPELYIAIGISGAIQHLAGMKDSKTIVAINKDPEAPIFSVADFGWVADYKTAVPALVKALG